MCDGKQLNLLGESGSYVLEGTLEACRRFAFASGKEIDRYDGRTLGCDGGRAIVEKGDAANFAICWLKNGGLIAKVPEGRFIVVLDKAVCDFTGFEITHKPVAVI